MVIRFSPEKPSGVLFDAAGNVIVRFVGLDTEETHLVKDSVDPTTEPVYSDDPPVIEARQGVPSMPEPEPPGDIDGQNVVGEFR